MLPRRGFGALAMAGLLVGCARQMAQARAVPDGAAPGSFAPLVRRVMPSVVNIAVTETMAGADPLAQLPPELRKLFRDRLGPRAEQVSGAGSGFIVDPSGVIVTNNHVVAGASAIVVSLSDGRSLKAKLLGADALTDVAVIKVEPPAPLPAVQWGDSAKAEVGDWVIACGNPFGLGGSVTAGIISARGRDIGAGPFDDFLQIDAPVNPGNSGGPLFDTEGRVIGMTSAILSPTGSSVGIGFAIPSALVRRIAAELQAHGQIERGWLGVSLRDTSQDNPDGAVQVVAVNRGGPAWQGGVRPGDLVQAVDGTKVAEARAVIRAVAATPPGHKVQLSIKRRSQLLDVTVTVGRRPNVEEN